MSPPPPKMAMRPRGPWVTTSCRSASSAPWVPKPLPNASPSARVYVTIDIDGFCPSIAPGTGTPIHGGFLYYEVLELLQQVARTHEVVGMDLVEVAPDYDPSQSTQILAAQVLLNFLGFLFHAKGFR